LDDLEEMRRYWKLKEESHTGEWTYHKTDYMMMMYLPLYQWEVICDLCLNWTSYGYDLVLEPERKQNMSFRWNTPVSEKKL
jgi:hypothetical protein